MQILVLGKSLDHPKYRGVDRTLPEYVAAYALEHPINQSFYWSTSIHDKGYLDDLNKALELVKLYSLLNPPQHFEIVEITNDDSVPVLSSVLLGYDLACGTYSLLSSGMNFCVSQKTEDDKYTVKKLICLIENYFKPQLNNNILFPEYSMARDCLDCMIALQQLNPSASLWEMDHIKFSLIGIWEVDLAALTSNPK